MNPDFFSTAALEYNNRQADSEEGPTEDLERWGLIMSKQGEWVDDMFMNAAGQAYGVSICCGARIAGLITKENE